MHLTSTWKLLTEFSSAPHEPLHESSRMYASFTATSVVAERTVTLPVAASSALEVSIIADPFHWWFAEQVLRLHSGSELQVLSNDSAASVAVQLGGAAAGISGAIMRARRPQAGESNSPRTARRSDRGAGTGMVGARWMKLCGLKPVSLWVRSCDLFNKRVFHILMKFARLRGSRSHHGLVV
jgi:hypothetical protein